MPFKLLKWCLYAFELGWCGWWTPQRCKSAITQLQWLQRCIKQKITYRMATLQLMISCSTIPYSK